MFNTLKYHMKQVTKNLCFQIVSFLVNSVISFFLVRFIVENIGEVANGFVGLANDFIGYIQVITIALNSMAGRFITVYVNKEKKQDVDKIYSTLFYANLFLSCALIFPTGILIYCLDKFVSIPKELMFDVKCLWAFMFLSFFINIVGSVFSCTLFAKNRLDLESKRNIVTSVINALLIFLMFFLFKPHVFYVGISTVAVAVSSFIISYIYSRKLVGKIELKLVNFNRNIFRKVTTSGMWNSFTKLSSIMSSGLDLLLCNVFVGATAMGELAISKTLPTVILSGFGVIAYVFTPQFTIHYINEEFEELKKQVNKSTKLMSLFSSIPVAFFVAFGADFYQLWVPSQDSKLLQLLTLISCLAFVFSLPLESIWNVFIAANKVKQSAIYLFMNSLLTILIVLFVVPNVEDTQWQLFIIAGTSTVFSIIRSLTFLPIYGAKCIKQKWYCFYGIILKNVILVCVNCAIALALRHFLCPSNWGILFADAFIASIVCIMINSCIILNKDDLGMIISKIKQNKGES